MLKRIIYFILGIIITSSALMYIVIYLNLLRMGYSMLDYVKYVLSSIECTKIFIGIILIILSLKKGRKMNYTYNIKVNLKNELINFYEWNKMDKITILKKVPVFKVNDNVYENIISGRVKVNDTFLDKISLSNYTSIFCNDIDTICIKFDNKGKIDKLSKLDLIEEKMYLKICEISKSIS